ncbi:MAG: hypothetical protein SYC29_12030, partial [Planctomycetota bacterium]|nr:hypothetical protein [Planctomycetota bacterium]
MDAESVGSGGAAEVTATPPRLGPVGEGERIVALDVLRGFAIYGILFMNIQFFAMPLGKAIDPTSLADATTTERAVWAFIKIFFESKFFSLFSLMFGVGLILQMQRAERAGRPFVGMYIRRLLVLMAIGLVHGVLLWYGDILFIYSFVGFLLFFLRKLGAKILLLLAVIAMLLSATCMGGVGAMGKVFADYQPNQATVEATPADDTALELAEPGAEDSTPRWLEALAESRGNPQHPSYREAERIAYREGPMRATIAVRAASFAGMLFFTIISGFGLHVVSVFFLGAALMKWNF